MIIPFGRRDPTFACAAVAGVVGALVALYYQQVGLTLSHYDARGHLIVARRIFDNVTPGWQQIGAVWLPLPHLLNAIPVQWDLFYRSGASAVAISVASFALAAGGLTRILFLVTGSTAASAAAARVLPFSHSSSGVVLLTANRSANFPSPFIFLLLPGLPGRLRARCRGRARKALCPRWPDLFNSLIQRLISATRMQIPWPLNEPCPS